MIRINSRVEAYVPLFPNSAGYYVASVAVNERRAHDFDIWEGVWKEMTEPERDAYLERCAITLINRYGDARKVRIREDGQIVPRDGEAEFAA